MPTISQLPSADSVSASDLIPISQGGSAHSVSVGALLAQTQPALIVAPPSILGRYSIGPGGPDVIAVGDGLTLNGGTLNSTSFSLASLPVQASLAPNDQIIVTNAGTSQLVGLDQIREIFTAGPNITIDTSGVISTSASSESATYSLTALSPVTTIGSEDLIGISQDGVDHAITYTNFLDGLTIDLASPATPASDSDTFWVGQTNNIMLRQSLGALWPWISDKLPSWKRPVIELDSDTTLDGAVHNNAILVCSSPISISAPTASIGSGFCCELINASAGAITFAANILTSNGSNGLSPSQCGSIQCVTYSVGTAVFASISAGSSAIVVPGQPSGLTASSITSSSLALSWSAPTSGGAISVYSVQFRTTGTTSWQLAGQNNGVPNYVVEGLQAATSYDFAVSAMNNVGAGPISSALTVSTFAAGFLPDAPSGVTVTSITINSLTCSWTAPATVGLALVYGIQYRVTGQSTWSSAATDLSATTVDIGNLTSATSYDIQVTASDSNGSGPPSAVVTAQTAQVVGLVTSITWALVPIGSYASGTGSIGVNAHVNPATASIQFGFSTSLTVPPTSWVEGEHVNSDLWGQYVSTPATSGSWYGWAEGTDGSCPTVYPTPFTVT